MALRRRHIFLDMQHECGTSEAARGTGADLSIHRLEPTVTQRPNTAVRTSLCSRNPFLTLRRPTKLQCLCKPRVQVEEQDLMRSSISPLPPTRRMRGAAQWCMQIECQFNSPDAYQLNQNDSSSRSESPWPVQGPTISNSQKVTEVKCRGRKWSKLKFELVTVTSLNIDIISRQTKYRRDRHVVYLGGA